MGLRAPNLTLPKVPLPPTCSPTHIASPLMGTQRLFDVSAVAPPRGHQRARRLPWAPRERESLLSEGVLGTQPNRSMAFVSDRASLSRRASLSDSAATRGVAPRVHKPNDPIPSQHTLLHSLFSLHLHQPQCLRIISTEHQVHRLNRARSGRRKGPPWGQHLKPFPMPSWTSTAHPSPPPQPTSSAWEGRGRSPPPPLSPQPRGLTSGPD